MTKLRFRPAAALLVAVAILTVAGCASVAGTGNASAGGPGAPATSTAAANSATGSYQDRVMTWARRFAVCVRSHGIPTFPDPVYPADAQPSGLVWGFTLFAAVDKSTL